VRGLTRRELADALRVPSSTIYKWSLLPGFPSSVGYRKGGGEPEIWDLNAVRDWAWDRRPFRPPFGLKGTGTDAQRRARIAKAADEVQRMRADGVGLRDIADTLDLSYSFVRKWAAYVAVPPRSRTRRRRFSDDELIDAIRRSEARTVYAYDRWRRGDPSLPSSATLIAHFGSWSAVLETGTRKRKRKRSASGT